MARLSREVVIAAALDLLDEVGIDNVTTRRLAQRLGVEQPALYWHFRNKADLLAAMAAAAMMPLEKAPLPDRSDDWRTWFLANFLRFRETLLLRRDGARLHASTRPSDSDRYRIARKIAFLVGAGFAKTDAHVAMLVADRLTVGSVLEEQAGPDAEGATELFMPDHDSAFEAGLAFLTDGMERKRTERAVSVCEP